MHHTESSSIRQVKALVWEYVGRVWWGQLLGLVGVIGFASIIYGVFTLEYELSFRDSEVGKFLHFGFYWATLCFLGAPILAAWGAPQRRYTLPMSSFLTVVCPMVCSMASMFALYAVAATTLNLLFEAGWPIWGPGLVAAFLVGWIQAVLWSTSNSQVLQMVSCLASFGVVLFGVVTYVSPGQPATGWFHAGLTPLHVVVFGLASLLCVGVGTYGFANLRCGGGLEVQRIADWVSRIFSKSARAKPFSSPTAAQFWLEWTERGYVMPLGIAIIGSLALFFTFVFSPALVKHGDAIEFINVFSAIILTPVLVVGIYMGARSEDGGFGNFNGSRPLSDSQIANALLKSTTVSVLSSVFVWAIVLGIVSLMSGLASSTLSLPNAIELLIGSIRLLGIAALGIGAVWGAVTLIASLVLAGKKELNVAVGTVIALFIVGGIGPRFLLSSEAQDSFQFVFGWACIVLPLVLVVAAYVASWRLNLISRHTLVLAAAIVGTMFVGGHVCYGFTSDLGPTLAALWICCLAPASLAAAPLAVWWNRHR